MSLPNNVTAAIMQQLRLCSICSLPAAEPELRREERRGMVGEEEVWTAQGLVAVNPVPKSVLECGKTVSGAGPEEDEA
jgi:hypothetical protein